MKVKVKHAQRLQGENSNDPPTTVISVLPVLSHVDYPVGKFPHRHNPTSKANQLLCFLTAVVSNLVMFAKFFCKCSVHVKVKFVHLLKKVN